MRGGVGGLMTPDLNSLSLYQSLGGGGAEMEKETVRMGG